MGVKEFLLKNNSEFQADRARVIYQWGVKLHREKDPKVYGDTHGYFKRYTPYAGLNTFTEEILESLGLSMDLHNVTYQYLHEVEVAFYQDGQLEHFYLPLASKLAVIDIEKYGGTSLQDYHDQIVYGYGKPIKFQRLYVEAIPDVMPPRNSRRNMIQLVDLFATHKLL